MIFDNEDDTTCVALAVAVALLNATPLYSQLVVSLLTLKRVTFQISMAKIFVPSGPRPRSLKDNTY